MTIVEVVIAVTLIVLASVFALSMTGVMTRFSNKARQNTKIDSLVDQDFANLERAAYQYTYCTGDYTWDGGTCTVGSSTYSPGDQEYYFPYADSASSANAEDFASDCKDGSMTDALLDAINGDDDDLALSTAATDLNLSRVVTLSSGNANRLLVTYKKGTRVYRQKLIVPVASYWCPDTSF